MSVLSATGTVESVADHKVCNSEQQPDLFYVKPSYLKAPLNPNEVATFVEALPPISFVREQSKTVAAAIETVHTALDGKVVWIDDFLTTDECEKLIAAVDSSSQLSFWSPSAVEAAGETLAEARAFRDAETLEMSSPELATALWDRLLLRGGGWIPASEVVAEEDDSELAGNWIPQAPLNHDLLFARYPSEGSFAPHTDGRATHDFNRRSFQSIIVFLNSIPDGCGGGTRFYSNEAINKLSRDESNRWTANPLLVQVEVLPRAGRILLFNQELLHEGVPVAAPYTKYIIRSDLMYNRTPAVCDSPTDRQAYDLFRQAENLAEAGRVQESLELFQKSWRLSPLMAKMMKIK